MWAGIGVTDFDAMPPAPGRPPNPSDSGHGDPPQGGPGYGPTPAPAPTPGTWPHQGFPPPGGYGPPTLAPVGAGILGKRRNPFGAWLGLPLITLGIYNFVWIYKTNKELAAFDQRIKVDPMLSVLAFLIGWIIIVPPFVAAWRLGDRLRTAQRAAGLPETSTALSFVLCLVGGGVLFLQYQINGIWERYPGAVEGQQVPLYH